MSARFRKSGYAGALLVRDSPARAGEVGIDRHIPLVLGVHVAASRVGLPDFDHRARHGSPVVIKNAPGADDALLERRAIMLSVKSTSLPAISLSQQSVGPLVSASDRGMTTGV